MRTVYGCVGRVWVSTALLTGKRACQERPGRRDHTERGCGKECIPSMKSELYHSVSWLGSNGRTYLTHSGGRYLLLGIAAIFAAFLSIQALAPAPAFAQDGEGSTAENPLVVESGTECAANPDVNGGVAYYETTVFDSITPADVIATISGCGITEDNSFDAGASATAAILPPVDSGDDLFELMEISAAQETALNTKVATNLHLKAGSELIADQVYNVIVMLSQTQETLDGSVPSSTTVTVTVHLKINVEVSLAANPNWRPGFTQVPADGSRTASLRDAFITGGDIVLTYTVDSSRTVIARARIIGTTARVDGISGGSAEITVTATAPNGTTATQTFPVRVREDLQPEPTPTPAPPTATPLPPVVIETPTPTPTATPVPPTATATATPRPTNTPEPTATATPVPPPATAPPTVPATPPSPGEGPGAAPFIVGLIILALLGVGAYLLLRRRGSGESPEGGPDGGMGPDDMLDDGMDDGDDGMDNDDADMDMDMEEDAADQDEAEEDGDGDGEDVDGDDDEDGDDEEEEERQ